MFRRKLWISVFSLFALTLGASAQIVIESGNLSGPGTNLTTYEVWSMEFQQGPTGGNQTWTLESRVWDDTTEATIVDPASTPYASTFPTATRATAASESGFNMVYGYERVAADGLYLLGMAYEMQSQQIVMLADPEVRQIPLPLEMGSTWTSVVRLVYQEYVVQADSSIHTVDAWGTLNTPFGSYPVLRIWERRWNLTEEDLDASYIFVNAQGVPVVEYASASANHDPNFTYGGLMVIAAGMVPANPVRGPVATSFAVGQNYPNPFNPSTALPVELQKQSRVEMSVYDETGRLVSTQSFELPAGSHTLPIDGSGWATGTYFARVAADGVAQTTKMQLVK